VESKWKNYHIITFPGQSLSKNRETQFGRGFGPVARQTNTSTLHSKWHSIYISATECLHHISNVCALLLEMFPDSVRIKYFKRPIQAEVCLRIWTELVFRIPCLPRKLEALARG
jgi:hypothetical protein